MAKKFIRTDFMRFSKLGKKRKSLQKWRRPSGRHNKLRKNRFSYPRSPTVGYKSPSKEAGKINGKNVVFVKNISDLEKVGKDSVVLLARIGARKKIEIIKKADENKIHILNVKGDKK